jgi:hypothetical protein
VSSIPQSAVVTLTSEIQLIAGGEAEDGLGSEAARRAEAHRGTGVWSDQTRARLPAVPASRPGMRLRRVAVALPDPQFIEDLETSDVASVTICGTGARRGRQRPLASTAEHPQPACDTILGQTPRGRRQTQVSSVEPRACPQNVLARRATTSLWACHLPRPFRAWRPAECLLSDRGGLTSRLRF